MDQQQLWARYAKYFTTYPSVGLSLDISRMRFADSFFQTMQPKMEKAFAEMAALEKGELANPDEKRMVGHYWLRDTKLAPTAEIGAEIRSTNEAIKKFAKEVHQGTIRPEREAKFKNVLVVGIGGSALGPQLVADALMTANDPMKVYFFDNTDPDGMTRTLQLIGDELTATLTIVVSKSGGTIETRNGALEAEAAYEKLGVSFKNHVVAVTGPGSKLDGEAESKGWLRRFALWDWVGGRTSLFSAVGLLPAALQGVAIDEFIAGAKEMDTITREGNVLRNPAAMLSLMWYAAGDG